MSKSCVLLLCLFLSTTAAFTGIVRSPSLTKSNGFTLRNTETKLCLEKPHQQNEPIRSDETALRMSAVDTSGDVYLTREYTFTNATLLTTPVDGINSTDYAFPIFEQASDSRSLSFLDQAMSSYWAPRAMLAAAACLYGTNFPLGSIMDAALPASAATSARFVIASLALSPFVFKLRKELIGMSLLTGFFTGMGYVAQSLALVDTSPATVSFLGAAIVVWCPFLEWLINKKPMSWKDQPQTWLAASFCMLGVGVLELCGGEAGTAGTFSGGVGLGDMLALLQALGFGTGLFLSEQMMKKYDDQALPITATLVAVTAFMSMIWALFDGWIGNAPGWQSMTLPGMFFDPSFREVAFAVVWTGLLSTSFNFFIEVSAIGKVPSKEGSVILASEPLWAALFASVLLGESFGWNDYVGGFFILAAGLVSSMKASDIEMLLNGSKDDPTKN